MCSVQHDDQRPIGMMFYAAAAAAAASVWSCIHLDKSITKEKENIVQEFRLQSTSDC